MKSIGRDQTEEIETQKLERMKLDQTELRGFVDRIDFDLNTVHLLYGLRCGQLVSGQIHQVDVQTADRVQIVRFVVVVDKRVVERGHAGLQR